ncbi:uncharacterized protein LOC132946672 isoform X2 [Metopolophium dirhodum]|uniref:uncharacterized protein LOC132946672 isoform X2 n=1 Tax=Metopolophium dirhodum TaxID=44670 RepID=UPI00298F5F98|nr:uncharacterized protein LOC132946672 isoform X2 [Metopolophium dirhodum]
MKRSKVKKIILTNIVKSSKDSKHCYLCDAIKRTHEHYNISSLLITVSQWDTKGSSKIRSIQQFKCFVCNYNSNYFNNWKTHIMSNGHMSMCHTLDKVCSYFCEACKTLFYGSEMCISHHQKDAHDGNINLSSLSILMSELMSCLDIYSKHVYFCGICKIVSETPIHTSGKHLNNQKLYDCKYCNTTFLCNTEELDFHEASVEHLTFKCIYSIKEAIEVNSLKIQKQDKVTKTTHDLQTKLKPLELPLIILDRFQKTSKSMAKCNFCNVLIQWSTHRIVKHVNLCLNKGNLTSEMQAILITAYDCGACSFKTNSFFNFKLHVISPIHLTNSHTSGDFYSYFCTICNLYIYASKIQINDHLKRKHKTNMTDLPLLSTFLKDNYNYISNHPRSDFIDYYSDLDQQYCEKDFQCNVCKISFCMSNYEYNLHEISSEHILLKYFTPTKPSLVMKHSYGYENVQTTSSINANLIINNEALSNKCLSSTKADKSNPEEISVNKENNKLFKNCNEIKSHSAISSTNSDHNIQQNVYIADDDGVKIADLNSTAEIEHAQEALHYVDVSTSSDDLRQKNIMYSKLKNTKMQNNIQSTDTQSNITRQYKQLHPTDPDQAYGQYVIERLKNIHNASLKSNIKIEIDALFCTYT